MGVTLLTDRHAHELAGVLSCWDRILVFGTLPKICYAEGMTSYLYARKIRIFDYAKFAEPFRNQLRDNAERLAADNAFVELMAPGTLGSELGLPEYTIELEGRHGRLRIHCKGTTAADLAGLSRALWDVAS